MLTRFPLADHPTTCSPQPPLRVAVLLCAWEDVVHKNEQELSFKVSGRSFVNNKDVMMLTDKPAHIIDGLEEALTLSAAGLSEIRSVAFFANTTDHGVFQGVMKVSRVDRLANGHARRYGVDPSSYIETNLTELSAGATFTDSGFCKQPQRCRLLQSMKHLQETNDNGRRKLAWSTSPCKPSQSGRKTWFEGAWWYECRNVHVDIKPDVDRGQSEWMGQPIICHPEIDAGGCASCKPPSCYLPGEW